MEMSEKHFSKVGEKHQYARGSLLLWVCMCDRGLQYREEEWFQTDNSVSVSTWHENIVLGYIWTYPLTGKELIICATIIDQTNVMETADKQRTRFIYISFNNKVLYS